MAPRHDQHQRSRLTESGRQPAADDRSELPGCTAEWVTADFTYRIELNGDMALTATVANMFDRDPPPAQEEFSYDPWTRNPLGRTFEIGVKKSF